MSSAQTTGVPRSVLLPRGKGTTTPKPPPAAAAPALGFGLFLVVNALLLLRPSDIFPDLADVPLYEAVIVACLLVSMRPVLDQLSPQSLYEHPATACVLGLLAAVALSHLTRFHFSLAYTSFVQFAKVVVYYLLLVAVVDSLSRLRTFLLALLGCFMALTVLALLQYHQAIDLPALSVLDQRHFDTEAGELVTIPRLRSAGIFNDPNDLCILLATGVVLGFYWVADGRGVLGRVLGMAALGMFGYALVLTKSRGGFLALVAGLLALFAARFGLRKGVLLAAAGLPLLFVLAGGRQTSISTTEGTAQERIQYWAMGFDLFRGGPIFGIGADQFAEHVGIVAHNSFVQCFVETGLVGGTCFVGIYFCPLGSLRRLGLPPTEAAHPEVRRLRPYLVAVVSAYVVGLFSLTRCYTVSTYLIVGLAVAYLRVATFHLPRPLMRLDAQLAGRLTAASAASLLAIYVFVRLFVSWG